MERRILAISYIAQGFRHDLKKHLVYAFQYAGPAAEILMQLDLLVLAFFCGISIILFQKKLRFRQPEAVYALFYIPYHKYVGLSPLLSGNALYDRLLYLIAVLIFVYKYLLVLPGKLVCFSGGHADHLS